MSKKLPVFAVIPNYNMGESLQELIPTLLNGDYDEVHVMDDASTDMSRDVIAGFGNDIGSVLGQENRGSAYNRNRILGVLPREAALHFIDADMIMETDRPAEQVREWMNREDVGFTGGLVKTQTGRQHAFNFGPRLSLHMDLSSLLQMHVDVLVDTDRTKAIRVRQRFSSALRDWPDPLSEPTERQVYFASEANLGIRSSVLEKLGGFDSDMRTMEIYEFAMRVQDQLGLKAWFSPAISEVHNAVNIRLGNRTLAEFKGRAHIIGKHGLKNYLLPTGQFQPELKG